MHAPDAPTCHWCLVGGTAGQVIHARFEVGGNLGKTHLCRNHRNALIVLLENCSLELCGVDFLSRAAMDKIFEDLGIESGGG